jgi:hypothetical protein
MRSLPLALQSLIVQIAAAVLAAGVLAGCARGFDIEPALWLFLLAAASCAAILSRALRQPVWWQVLHTGFLPAVALAQRAQLPGALYLTAFLLLLIFYWSCHRTRVPLYLSNRRARAALSELMPRSKNFSFIDLGSGLGGVPLYLESRFPAAHLVGTEIAPAPFLISRVRGWLRGSRVGFLRRDYQTLDLAAYDVVFAFLSPAAMPRLWQQACAQMRVGSLLVSLSFADTGRAPDRVVALAPGRRHTLYVWQL